MKELFKNIKNICSILDDDIIVMFSTGKDATVMLDLLMNNYNKDKLHVVYMYFIKDLSFKNNILTYYQNKYKIKIDVFPHYELTKILKKRIGKKYYSGANLSFSDMQSYLRKKYKTSWIAYGYRTGESIERAQMIRAEAPDGIDHRNKKIYPVADWRESDVYRYIKSRKLPLTIEYSFGYRDINMPYDEILHWLKLNYPDDYKRAIEQYPFLEGDLFRWEMKNQNLKIS